MLKAIDELFGKVSHFDGEENIDNSPGSTQII